MISAIGKISKENPNAKLLILGEGEEKENLRKFAIRLKLKDRVIFKGEIPNKEVTEYMVASDVFALPSLSEGFPVTILEAMASGLPIVVTKVTGITEIIINGENGFLAEPKNTKEIAEKILLLLEDEEMRERISRNNKENVKKYRWESVVERLEEIYRSYNQIYT